MLKIAQPQHHFLSEIGTGDFSKLFPHCYEKRLKLVAEEEVSVLQAALKLLYNIRNLVGMHIKARWYLNTLGLKLSINFHQK